MKVFKFLSVSCLVLALSFSAQATQGVIGSYANGCIQGALKLENSPDYQIQRWSKEARNFGHPILIEYIKDLAAKAKANSLPRLLIGDLSLKKGGPFLVKSNHGSHQNGLDVDISFDFATPKKTSYELNHPKDIAIVDGKGNANSNFDENRVKLIYLAANDDKVARIFVSPGIKRHLCNLYKNEDRAWLNKLRPWFGHRAHMHVRLSCPLDSTMCQNQQAQPQGDGCGEELASWFLPPDNTKVTPKKKLKKVLPKECQLLLAK